MIRRAPRPESDFTQIRNEVLRDERLSYRARGILVAILSRPDNWRVSRDSLARQGKEGRDAINTAINELVDAGYIQREKSQQADGTWATELVVYDSYPQDSSSYPQVSDSSEEKHADFQAPTTGKPTTGKPTVGKPVANKNNVKNKDTNKDKNTDNHPTCIEPECATSDDVSRFSIDTHNLCSQLADWIVHNGGRNPNITHTWLNDMDKLIRLDHATPQQIETIIDWCQQDTFWHTNILSPNKLRKQWDRLVMQYKAQNKPNNRHSNPNADVIDQLIAQHQPDTQPKELNQ